MSDGPDIAVFCGGAGSERDVSLRSGEAMEAALGRRHRARRIVLERDALPQGADPGADVVFPAMHGGYGENGGLQTDLEARGFAYAGSGPVASALCMDKAWARQTAEGAGVAVPKGLCFEAGAWPSGEELRRALGDAIVLKPRDEGSSVGLRTPDSRAALDAALEAAQSGAWVAEERIAGREMTVGILGAEALGIVEVASPSGVYDYDAKYSGEAEYRYPAPVDEAVARRLRRDAERMFAACGCRDFGRVDFMLPEDGTPRFLEVNTLPGLTSTSLLPKSASCAGLDFEALAERLVAPAIERFRALG